MLRKERTWLPRRRNRPKGRLVSIQACAVIAGECLENLPPATPEPWSVLGEAAGRQSTVEPFWNSGTETQHLHGRALLLTWRRSAGIGTRVINELARALSRCDKGKPCALCGNAGEKEAPSLPLCMGEVGADNRTVLAPSSTSPTGCGSSGSDNLHRFILPAVGKRGPALGRSFTLSVTRGWGRPTRKDAAFPPPQKVPRPPKSPCTMRSPLSHCQVVLGRKNGGRLSAEGE